MAALLITGVFVIANANRPQRIGYFADWNVANRDFTIKNLADSGAPARLDRLMWAFGDVSEDGLCHVPGDPDQSWELYQRRYSAQESVDGRADDYGQELAGSLHQLRLLQGEHPDLRASLSLGGWNWSRYFSTAARTEESRREFVTSCVDLWLRGDLPVRDDEPQGGEGAAAGVFDGIDLDWEWPGSEGHPDNTVRPEDRENFTALVQEFRDQLDDLEDETGRDYELTAFVPADPDKVEAGYEIPQIMPNLDFLTVQGYDFHGAWDAEGPTNHQSNLVLVDGDPGPDFFSSEIAVDAYLERGADPEDLLLGLPFYGRGWEGVEPGPNGDGLFQPATAPAPASPLAWDSTNQNLRRRL
jgi:chitinase